MNERVAALYLNLCIDWGIDSTPELELKKDKAIFYKDGHRIEVPVEIIDYDGYDLAFTDKTFNEDSGIIIYTKKTISMFKRSTVKQLIQNNKRYINKYKQNVWTFPHQLLNLPNIIHLGVRNGKQKTDAQSN